LTPDSRVVVRAAVPRRRSPVSVTLLTLTPCRGAPHARLARPGEGRPTRGVRTGTPGRDVTDGGGGALSGPGAAPDYRAAPDGGVRGWRPVQGRERFVSRAPPGPGGRRSWRGPGRRRDVMDGGCGGRGPERAGC